MFSTLIHQWLNSVVEAPLEFHTKRIEGIGSITGICFAARLASNDRTTLGWPFLHWPFLHWTLVVQVQYKWLKGYSCQTIYYAVKCFVPGSLLLAILLGNNAHDESQTLLLILVLDPLEILLDKGLVP